MFASRLNIPIVLIIYKRPNTTRCVLDAISQVSPSHLFVIGDGPRPESPNEAEKVIATRKLIRDVDIECEVITNYSDINLGLRRRVSSGLDWVFEQVEEAIILEDDCVPNPSFFYYCEELLDRFKNDDRIWLISGDNFQQGRKRTQYSYYFSRYNHCWGWATWRRAWQHYDDSLNIWPIVRDGGWLMDILDQDRLAVRYWRDIFQCVYEGRIDSWAYCWIFACWVQRGLTVLPNVNLVSNIGFGQGATHTLNRSRSANLPVEELDIPLKHPPFIIRDVRADKFTQDTHYGTGFMNRIKKKITQVLKNTSVLRIV